MHEVKEVQRLIYSWGTVFQGTCSCGMSFTAQSRKGATGKLSRHIEFCNVYGLLNR